VIVGRTFVYRELRLAADRQASLPASAGAISAAIMFLVGGAIDLQLADGDRGRARHHRRAWFQAMSRARRRSSCMMNILPDRASGMPMESFAMILLLSPIFLEVAVSYGLDPVHIAVVFVFNCVIAMISPPFGGTLFVSAMIAGRPISAVTRKVYVLWAMMTAVLLLITYVPDLVLFLPRMAGFVQ
jgi:C4-dicarboxylate transporter, DctM subunit